MRNFECPSCGAPVQVNNPGSVWAVCSYCDSTLVLTDDSAVASGKMARLMDDPSPLQIGTHGDYHGADFELIGRIQQRWDRGWWNEWHAWFADGSSGWLTDAQGMYAFSTETPHNNLPDRAFFEEKVAAGDALTLSGRKYVVNDVKRVSCAVAEGELPFPAPLGREAITVDLVSKNHGFGTLEWSDNRAWLYEGNYLPFKKLKLKNMREVQGW